MALRYRYSEWDGTQEISGLTAEQILDALSDDLMTSVISSTPCAT